MRAFLLCLMLWILAVLGETVLIPSIPYLNPNLFYLVPLVLAFRWKRPETWIVAGVFGFTADSFASTPVGLYATSFFIMNYLHLQIAIRFFQRANIFLLLLSGGFVFLTSVLANFLLILMDNEVYWSILFRQELFFQVIPTAALSIPLYHGLAWAEKQLKIKTPLSSGGQP